MSNPNIHIYIYTPYSNIGDYINRVYNPLRESPFFTLIIWDFVVFANSLDQQRPDESVARNRVSVLCCLPEGF